MRVRRVPAVAGSAFRVRAVAGLCFALLAGFTAPARGVLPTDFSVQSVTPGFSLPTSFQFLPDGRILVIEKQTGRVWLVVNGVKGAAPILTLTDVNTSGWEQGLLGLAVDPRWPDPAYVYLYYDRTPGNMIYIVRYKATGDLSDGSSTNLTLGSRFVILNDIPDNTTIHNAGTLRFGPDGKLYASLGDDSNHCFAQDSTDFRGKILRLNVAALPDTGAGPPAKSLITPSDNPFLPGDPEEGLLYAMGLRNPFRFQIDSVTGALYIGDVGLQTYEELDECFGGENYGWPYREGPITQVVGTCPEPGGSGSQSYDPPIAYYNRLDIPGASVIGWVRYRPVAGGTYTFPPLYNGVVFYSDFSAGFVRAIRNVGGVWAPLDSVPGQPNATDWATQFTQVVDTQIGPDGAIYVLQHAGNLWRIVYTGDASGVGDDLGLRARLEVRPNPLARGARLTVHATEVGENAAIRIYAATGRRVRSLRAGPGDWTWDGRDDAGTLVAPGVYLVSARGALGSASTRVVVTP